MKDVITFLIPLYFDRHAEFILLVFFIVFKSLIATLWSVSFLQ